MAACRTMSEWSKLIAEERFLESREEERNKKITAALAGRRKPPDEAIVMMIKERWKHGLHDRQVQILRK